MLKRLVLVINPRSSGFSNIKNAVYPQIEKLNLPKSRQTTYEIQPTNPMDNARKMAKILQDGDTILVAGGDGTAHIASNAMMISDAKDCSAFFTGFGNFNDFAYSFSNNNVEKISHLNDEDYQIKSVKPMEIRINGEFYEYATLYSTIGMTAEMAEIFEHPRVRNTLKKPLGRNTRLIFSLLSATRFYFKNRKKNDLDIKSMSADGHTYKFKRPITDLVFMNGPRMARIMKSKANLTDGKTFGFQFLNSSELFKNIPFIIKGIFRKTPLFRAEKTEIIFSKAQTISMQIEGEERKIKNVRTINIDISTKKINIINFK